MSPAAITAENLVVGYPGRIALSSSTFTVPSASVTAVIGPNGSGKSTLLNVIARLNEPISGTIETGATTDRISYVMQSTTVNEALPVTVEEVVAMGRFAILGPYRRMRAEDRDAIADAMMRTDVTRLKNRHLHDLSGGERQRVLVAQGLAQDHDLLLLDEPLTGIDFPTAKAIDGIIHDEVSRGCTVVMTTHDLSEAHAADHVVLVAGRVVASGTPDEALTAAALGDAYGHSLLHFDDGQPLIDDAAHEPVEGRHVHLDRGKR